MGEKIAAQRILMDQQQQLIEHLSRELLLLMRGTDHVDADFDEESDLVMEDPSADFEVTEEGNLQHFRNPHLLQSDMSSPVPTPHNYDFGSLIDSYSGSHMPEPQSEGAVSNMGTEFRNVALTEHERQHFS